MASEVCTCGRCTNCRVRLDFFASAITGGKFTNVDDLARWVINTPANQVMEETEPEVTVQ